MKITGNELRQYLRTEQREYLRKIGAITDDEKKELYDWVESGNSPWENPHLLYDEFCKPMDFVTACRICDEMHENPSDFSWGNQSEPEKDQNDEEAIPF